MQMVCHVYRINKSRVIVTMQVFILNFFLADNVVPLAIKIPEPPRSVASMLIADKATRTGDIICEIKWAERRPKEELSKLQHVDDDLSVLFI